MPARARLLAICLFALVLSACATATLTRIAYNNAASTYSNLGPMLTWIVDGYADLDGNREDWVRSRLERTLSWHRAEELPKVRELLETMLRKSDAPFRVEDIAHYQRELREAYRRVLARLIPDTAELLLTLDAAQVAHIEQKLADDDRKYVKESIRGTPEERLEHRTKRFANHLQAWIGDLSDEQRQLIVRRHREMEDLSDDLLAERRYRRSEVVRLVKEHAPREKLESELRRLFLETDAWRRPDYKERMAARDAKLHALIAELSGTLSDRQREALRHRIRAFIDDVAKLSAQAR
jgi:3-methyladenine DNA glycosylase AlkC